MGVTVRQKTKGKGKSWWVFVTHNGKRTSRMIGDKAAANAVASKIRAKLQLGEFDFEPERKPSMPTFKLYAEGFMETYSAMNHKPSTHGSYRTALDLHLLSYFGETALDSITRKDVKDFIHTKLSEGLSSGSVRNLKAYLSSILSEAVDDELISSNPVSMTGKLIKKKDITKHIDPLTWEERTLLENTTETYFSKWYPFILTENRTGLRLGELISLEPGDLDFNGRFIEIRRSFTKGQLTAPKNGKIRRVDMSAKLSEVLKRYLTDRKKEAFKKGWGEPPRWLFYNGAGGMVDGDGFRRRVFNKILEKAELRHIRFHDLRHTYATLRLMKGDNVVDVSKQLGHSSVKVTLDIYAHWVPGAKKAEVDELDLQTAPKCTLSAPCPADANKKEAGNLPNPLK